jgi:hypothetical protein
MLDVHFAGTRSIMRKDFVVVCAPIPWRLKRPYYDAGEIIGNNSAGIFASVKAKLSRVFLGDSLGYWNQPREIATLADKDGFSVDFYGSMFYPYRIHAVLKLG